MTEKKTSYLEMFSILFWSVVLCKLFVMTEIGRISIAHVDVKLLRLYHISVV